jgi:hypothetical protein
MLLVSSAETVVMSIAAEKFASVAATPTFNTMV